MASRNVSNTSTVADRSIYLHKGVILKKMYLKLLCYLVSLRNKVIRGNFETTTYLQLRICGCLHLII